MSWKPALLLSALAILGAASAKADDYFLIKNEDSREHTVWVFEDYKDGSGRDQPRTKYFVKVPARSGAAPGQNGFNPGYNGSFFGSLHGDRIVGFVMDDGKLVRCESLTGYKAATREEMCRHMRNQGYEPEDSKTPGEKGIQLPRTLVIWGGELTVHPR